MSSQPVEVCPERRLTKQLGRPAIPYNAEIAEDICLDVASCSRALGDILASDARYPSLKTFTKWLNCNDELAQMYARAKMLQADLLGEEILTIVDGEGQAHDKRVRMDGRRWLMSKLHSFKYGDKLDVTSGGEPLPPPSPLVIDARVQTIMLAAQRRRDAENLLED